MKLIDEINLRKRVVARPNLKETFAKLRTYILSIQERRGWVEVAVYGKYVEDELTQWGKDEGLKVERVGVLGGCHILLVWGNSPCLYGAVDCSITESGTFHIKE